MKLLSIVTALLLICAAGPALAAEPAAELATIVAGMAHFPSNEQKARLAEIAADETVDADLRTIAGSIGGIAHQASAADKAKLQAIVDDPAADAAEKTLAGAVLRFNHQVAAEDAAALAALTE